MKRTAANIEEGTLWLMTCARPTWLNKIIRKVVGKGHSALLWKKNGRVMVADASKYGAFVWTYNNWLERFGFSYELVQIPQVGKTVSLEQALFELEYFYGSKYPRIELLKHLLYKYTGLWIRTKREDEFPTCGELVMTVMRKLGLYQGEYAYMFNPAQVHDWATENLRRFGQNS